MQGVQTQTAGSGLHSRIAKVIHPFLLHELCLSSIRPEGYRNDLVETCWLLRVSDISDGSLFELLL